MGHRKVIENYYCDIDNLVELLWKLSNVYLNLVHSADELNKIGLSNKKQIKETLKRVEEVGDLIDELIETLDCVGDTYLKYCHIKCKIIECKLKTGYILEEINECLGNKIDKKDECNKKQ